MKCRLLCIISPTFISKLMKKAHFIKYKEALLLQKRNVYCCWFDTESFCIRLLAFAGVDYFF